MWAGPFVRAALFDGAGNGTRTRDIQLGRLTLYQLSYSREALVRNQHTKSAGAEGRIRTFVTRLGQIYSLLPLAAWLPLPDLCPGDIVFFPATALAGGGTRTRDLLITNQLLYQLSYTGRFLRNPSQVERGF